MSFIESRIPVTVAPGGTYGPAFMTTIKQLRGGGEHRNQVWANPLRKFTTTYNVRDRDTIHDELLTFMMQTRGAYHGFRAKDYSDFEAADEAVGSGNGTRTAFRFSKQYADYSRRVMKPVTGTISIEIDAVVVAPGDYTLDLINGVVIFDTAPAPGVDVTWSGEFDVPVRFADDAMSIMMAYYEKGSVPSVGLVEIRIRETVDYTSVL